MKAGWILRDGPGLSRSVDENGVVVDRLCKIGMDEEAAFEEAKRRARKY